MVLGKSLASKAGTAMLALSCVLSLRSSTAFAESRATRRTTNYSYTDERHVLTIDSVSGRNLSQIFSLVDRTVTRAKRSVCSNRSSIYVESIELNGGSVESATTGSSRANGNTNASVSGTIDGSTAVALATGSSSNNNLPSVVANARMTVVCRTRITSTDSSATSLSNRLKSSASSIGSSNTSSTNHQ